MNDVIIDIIVECPDGSFRGVELKTHSMSRGFARDMEIPHRLSAQVVTQVKKHMLAIRDSALFREYYVLDIEEKNLTGKCFSHGL